MNGVPAVSLETFPLSDSQVPIPTPVEFRGDTRVSRVALTGYTIFIVRHDDGATELRGSEALLSRVLALRPAPPDTNIFRRDGHYWTLSYDGKTVRLKDAKGLRDVACLLASPGEGFHVAELMATEPDDPRSTSHREMTGAQLAEVGLDVASDHSEPVLDAQARQQYRERLAELQSDLEEAENMNDQGRAERARQESDTIAAALASACGLGGRARVMGSSLERARIAVAMRIRNALVRIEKEHHALGNHLSRSIKKGLLCSYQPEVSADWAL
jgi:hypothetical protein